MAFDAGNRGPIMGEPSAGSTGKTAVLTLAGEGSWKLRVTVTPRPRCAISSRACADASMARARFSGVSVRTLGEIS